MLPMTDNERIGRAVRAELDRAGLSAREMSRRLGRKEHFLFPRLKGEVAFRLTELTEIAEQLGVPVTRLYEPDAAAALADTG